MTVLNPSVVNRIKSRKGIRCRTRLALNFGVGEQSISNWLNGEHADIRLTTPDALHVISEEMGIPHSQLLTVVKATA